MSLAISEFFTRVMSASLNARSSGTFSSARYPSLRSIATKSNHIYLYNLRMISGFWSLKWNKFWKFASTAKSKNVSTKRESFKKASSVGIDANLKKQRACYSCDLFSIERFASTFLDHCFKNFAVIVCSYVNMVSFAIRKANVLGSCGILCT